MLARLKLKDEIDANVQLSKAASRRYAGLETAIQNIASVSKSVIQDLNGGFYHRHESTAKESYCYNDSKNLAHSEIDFYTKCSTIEGVLDLHHQNIVHTLDECGAYQLFPIHSFSEVQLKGE